nr:hypothetical protein [Tanacetum cinerariifolium]
MGTIDSVKSILTQSALDALWEKFYIPDVVLPELPTHNDRIHNIPTEMALFAFIHHADPTKLQIGERESAGNDNVNEKGDDAAVTDDVVDVGGIDIMADSEIQAIVADQLKRVKKKRKAADGASGSGFPPKKLREDHGAFGDVGAGSARKSLTTLKGLLDRSILATEMFVVLSDSFHHFSTSAADDEVTSIVRSSMPPLHVMTAAVTTTTAGATYAPVYMTLRKIYIPKWNVVNDPTLDDMDICQSMIDQLAPFVFFFLLWGMNYEQFFAMFNVGATRQANWLKERDAEIANLKAHLSLKEAKATQAIRLRGQIATVKATEVAQVSELDGLKKRNAALEGQDLSSLQLSYDELSINASTLDFEKEKLVDQISQLEVLSDKVAELDADLIRMALHLDEEFYPWYLTTIAGQSPAAETNYVAGVNALCVVDFPLLAHLASHQDSSLYDLMDLLRLEGPAAETSKVVIGEFLIFSLDLAHACVRKLKENDASQQLSISNALIPIVEPLSVENLIGEASTFGFPVTATTTALSTTFVQDSTIPLVLAVDHGAFGARLSTEVPSPSKIVFEKEELDTTSKHTTAP